MLSQGPNMDSPEGQKSKEKAEVFLKERSKRKES